MAAEKENKVSELFARMERLGLWDAVMTYPWAFKPAHSIYPYFVYIGRRGKTKSGKGIQTSLLFLEGWQSFHDFVGGQRNPEYGYYLSPSELSSYEVVMMEDGRVFCGRHDPGVPVHPAGEENEEIVYKMMWQLFGIMMRLESDAKMINNSLAGEKFKLFCRVEGAKGVWADEFIELPPMPNYVARANMPSEMVKAMKDWPIDGEAVVEVDLRLADKLIANRPGKLPRNVYLFLVVDARTGETVYDDAFVIDEVRTCKSLMEDLTYFYLKYAKKRGSFPAEVRVKERRVFRQFRFLAQAFSFKLVLKDDLEKMDDAMARSQLNAAKMGEQRRKEQEKEQGNDKK